MKQENRLQLIKKKKKEEKRLRDKTRINNIRSGTRNIILAFSLLIIMQFKLAKAVFPQFLLSNL